VYLMLHPQNNHVYLMLHPQNIHGNNDDDPFIVLTETKFSRPPKQSWQYSNKSI
jgi:hypothetical protein